MAAVTKVQCRSRVDFYVGRRSPPRVAKILNMASSLVEPNGTCESLHGDVLEGTKAARRPQGESKETDQHFAASIVGTVLPS